MGGQMVKWTADELSGANSLGVLHVQVSCGAVQRGVVDSEEN
jgi:hypothetical protein